MAFMGKKETKCKNKKNITSTFWDSALESCEIGDLTFTINSENYRKQLVSNEIFL